MTARSDTSKEEDRWVGICGTPQSFVEEWEREGRGTVTFVLHGGIVRWAFVGWRGRRCFATACCRKHLSRISSAPGWRRPRKYTCAKEAQVVVQLTVARRGGVALYYSEYVKRGEGRFI